MHKERNKDDINTTNHGMELYHNNQFKIIFLSFLILSYVSDDDVMGTLLTQPHDMLASSAQVHVRRVRRLSCKRY